jgi:hypothetical protein
MFERATEDPADLDPLHDYVDPDALDTLFASETAGSAKSITIEYLEDVVTVYRDGTAAVRRPNVGRS